MLFDPPEQDVFLVGEGFFLVFFLIGPLPLLLEIEIVFLIGMFQNRVGDGADPRGEEVLLVFELQNLVEIIMERAFVIGVDRGIGMLQFPSVPLLADQGVRRVISVPWISPADVAGPVVR